LTVITSASWGGAASSVAGGQHPVLRRPSWCHGEAGIRLQSHSTACPSPTSLGIVDHMGLARGGWWSAIVLRSPFALRPVNSCRICSDACNIGLFITQQFPVYQYVATLSRSNINVFHVNKIDEQACHKI